MSEELAIPFQIDPNFRLSLTAEQQATLETIERLGELDPEITARLARALDRIQQTRPYQTLKTGNRESKTSSSASQPELTEAERLAREEFITQELAALLTVAGEITQAFESSRPRVQADRRFRENLRSQFKPQS